MSYRSLRAEALERAAATRLRSARSRATGSGRRDIGPPDDEPLRLKGGSNVQKIKYAIQAWLPIQIYYRDVSPGGVSGTRRGVPYGIYSRRGRTYLHMWVIRPSATRHRLPGWRTYILAGVTAVRLPPGKDEALLQVGARRAPGYRPSYYNIAKRPAQRRL